MMRNLRNIIPSLMNATFICLFVLLATTDVKAADSPVLNIFLVQNSGWMEPFYVDTNSKFKPLIESVIEKINYKGDEIVVASFNQSIGDNRSPLLVYRGKSNGAILKAINSIELAKKPGRNTLADTDCKEAVFEAITQYSPGRPCILWIFTNNKNSPYNNAETATMNKEFCSWLQNEVNIRRIVAYPYPMTLRGARYQANGLMIYAIAYSEAANIELVNLIAAKRPFADQPARLKPLNTDAVTFVPTGVANQGNFSADLDTDDNTLVLQFDSSSRPEMAIINGVFRNDFYPYDIRSANVSLDVTFKGENYGIQHTIEPRELVLLSAGHQSTAMAVKIGIPSLPSIWNPEIIFRSGYQVQATMLFRLSNQELQLSPEFVQRMNELFPGDPLPEIFTPNESVKQSETARALLVKVVYPTWPLVVLVLLCLSAVLGGLWLMTAASRPRKFTVMVEGTQKTFALKVFSKCPLYSENGDRIGSLSRGFGKPTVKLEGDREEKVNIL